MNRKRDAIIGGMKELTPHSPKKAVATLNHALESIRLNGSHKKLCFSLARWNKKDYILSPQTSQ
ncbi:MAG: hypothetical protein HQK57_16330 [Deltaproteobacteria bacterium]|nr:hypothetical protein [Deltaproteobacteria bacterium]MBF0525426.1 hypothetical protein [Deltaproteobacteria bacterium]